MDHRDPNSAARVLYIVVIGFGAVLLLIKSVILSEMAAYFCLFIRELSTFLSGSQGYVDSKLIKIFKSFFNNTFSSNEAMNVSATVLSSCTVSFIELVVLWYSLPVSWSYPPSSRAG